MTVKQFDVFLAHNSKDKPSVRYIYQNLKDRGLNPWLDIEEIPPGTSHQVAIQRAIEHVKTAAICIGQEGLGQWQDLELKALITQCVTKGIPVIPVLLPGVTKIPMNLLFLKEFNRVEFIHINDDNAFRRLEWGITQTKPTEARSLVSHSILPIQTQLDSTDVSLEELKTLLSEENIKEADAKTKKIILASNGGKSLTAPAIRQISIELLGKIDSLWFNYSDGKFGLVVQRQIWQQCLEPQRSFNPFVKDKIPTDSQAWKQLGHLVGWRDEEGRVLPDTKIKFSMTAPLGCFPQARRWLHGGFGNDVKQFTVLVDRLSELPEVL